MKALLIAIVLSFPFYKVSGQQKSIYLDSTFDKFWGDIRAHFRATQELATELGLQDLTKSRDTFSIRCWRPGAVFELSFDSAGKLKTRYKNYIWKLKGYQKGPLISRTVDLPPDSSWQIFRKLESTNFATLLKSDRNKWGYPAHGTFYEIEISAKNSYRYHTFCQVTGPDPAYIKIDEYKVLQDVLLFIEQKIDYWKFFNAFFSSQPKGIYTHGAGRLARGRSLR